jgi:hypothetical protein
MDNHEQVIVAIPPNSVGAPPSIQTVGADELLTQGADID